MRVLLVLPAEKSIFNYLVPVTWALRTAGHEVHVASLPRFASTITQAGLTAVPVGHDRDPWRITENRPEERAALRAGVAAPYDLFDVPGSATWDYLRDGMTAAVKGWHRLTNFPMVADLVEYTRYWEPDLVLWEPLCYAGAIAAKACGAAHGRLLFGIDVFGATRVDYLRTQARQAPADRVDPLADWLGSYARKYGFDAGEDLAVGDFTIDQLPASLSLDAGLDTVRVQFVPYGGAAVVPDWLKRPAERPRVALTLGLTATEVFGGYNVPLSEILLGLSELDVEVVATVAEDVQRTLPPMPSNVRMVPYVPWHALAPTCAAVVHHAGAATLATTARHPVPQLALHFHFDQPYLGRKLAEHGAGLEIHTGDATGGGVRDAVARLLTEQSFKARAADLRDEIFALPTPNELAGTLEELTAKHSRPAAADPERSTMRVLFATTPQKSVFLYLAPMAWALRTAGHEVRFASQPALTDVITQSGLTAVPVGHTRNRRLNDVDGREEGRAGLPAPYDVFDDYERATWEYLEPGMADAVRGWHWLTNHPMVGGLVEFARAWQPDLIVWEPFCYAGPIAAKACGAAHARLLFGVDVFGAAREQYRRRLAEEPGRVDHLGAWLGRYARMYGAEFSEDMTTGQFTIDQFPASLQPATELDVLRTQYIPYGGPAVVPSWLSKPPERPRVAMTLGLTATEHFNGYTVGVQEALDALADLDIDLVATVAEKAQAELTRIPDNARIVSYVPWHALAPTCSVVVHHAGAATMATTSRHPVPQLALHHHYDQPFLGRKLAEHGAGLELPTHRATGARIRESVERLLTEQSFKDRAADLRDEILGLPSPNAIVPEIEARVR